MRAEIRRLTSPHGPKSYLKRHASQMYLLLKYITPFKIRLMYFLELIYVFQIALITGILFWSQPEVLFLLAPKPEMLILLTERSFRSHRHALRTVA